MKRESRTMSKIEVKKYIDSFFSRPVFKADEMKKIKRLAMKYNIKLGSYRKCFCKSCLSQLKGKIRINKTHKAVFCEKCGQKNKLRI